MPLDPSISLQVKNPDLNTLGSFLDLGNKKLALDKGRATFDADVAQRQADSSTSQSAAAVNAANVNPLIQQQAATTGTSQAQMSDAQLKNARAHLSNAAQQLQVLIQKPDLGRQDIEDSLKQTLHDANAPLAAYAQAAQALPPPGLTPDAYRQYANQKLLSVQSAGEQLSAKYPASALVNNGAQTQSVTAGNEGLTGIAPGTLQGQAIPNQVSPGAQEEVQLDAQGRRYIVQKSPQGVIVGTRPVPGTSVGGAPPPPGAPPASGPVNLPPNETEQSLNQLQSERTAAQQAILQAPQMHNINQEISRIADTDVQTGKLGMVGNKIASAMGYHTPEWAGTNADYNTLGKMLARSNATLAASMPGPHTNAGLEQTNAANGSPEYDKVTLKKIANLNDALVTGTQLYQRGLENAVQQNGIFGKRQFDQAWSKTMDIDALRYKNAVDNGNQGEIAMIRKTLGTDGMRKMLGKLEAIGQLAGP